MDVQTRHFVEAVEADANGLTEHHVAYTVFDFTEGGAGLRFMIYDNAPTEAVVVGIPPPPPKSPLFRAAVAHLLSERQVKTVRLYDREAGCFSDVAAEGL
jgi:predicted ATP-grasp superfamily ATP-dependent carboligase